MAASLRKAKFRRTNDSLQRLAELPHFAERAASPSTSFFGRLFLYVDCSFEVRTFSNGDALGRNVARDDGRLL